MSNRLDLGLENNPNASQDVPHFQFIELVKAIMRFMYQLQKQKPISINSVSIPHRGP